MSRKYKVRFHLGAGENRMKWQVKDLHGVRRYYDPTEVSLEMLGCRLHNNRRVAERIRSGANKTVCAWISCSEVRVVAPRACSGYSVRYNPKVRPHWTDESGIDLDGSAFGELVTSGRMVICMARREAQPQRQSSSTGQHVL